MHSQVHEGDLVVISDQSPRLRQRMLAVRFTSSRAHQGEAQALHALHGQAHEGPLLVQRQHGGAVGARLVNLGLHGGPVCGEGPIHWLPL